MRVVDTRDFCIPSDENDYDELVAFADTMASIQQFDAVPIDVLDKIRAEIEQNAYPIIHGVNNHEKGMTLYGILQIIDKYKAERNDK